MFQMWNIAISQLNESDTLRFQFKSSITASWQKGNVDLKILRSKIELVSNTKKAWVYKTQNTSLFQQFGAIKVDNDIQSRNYVYWKTTKRIYPFAMVYMQTNFRRKIVHRFFAGIGFTFQAIKAKNHVLKFSFSSVYEQTEFRSNVFNTDFYNGQKTVSIWRPTFYFSGYHKGLKNHLKFHYVGIWQVGIDKVSNQRLQAEFGCEFLIWKNLALQANYLFNFEELVAKGIQEIDQIATFGLTYQIKK